jgi:hypothetical protein
MYQNSDNSLRHGNGDPTGLKVAKGLGWFSLALGTLELLATRELTRSLGMRGNEPLVQLYGLREIASGIGLLAAKDPTPWVWARVLGDALDIGTLAAHFNEENPEEANVAMALANVAVVTAIDVYAAQRLSCHGAGRGDGERNGHDYSDRSGLPQGAVAGGQRSRSPVGSESAATGNR